MEDGLKKKLVGVGAAALAAFVFGESQILEMDERLQAVEKLLQEDLDAAEEELQTEEESAPALGKPGMSAPPIEEPVEDEASTDEE